MFFKSQNVGGSILKPFVSNGIGEICECLSTKKELAINESLALSAIAKSSFAE